MKKFHTTNKTGKHLINYKYIRHLLIKEKQFKLYTAHAVTVRHKIICDERHNSYHNEDEIFLSLFVRFLLANDERQRIAGFLDRVGAEANDVRS